MRGGRLRAVAFVVALAASWAILLLWAAQVDWRAPLSPQTTRAIDGSDFHPIFGNGSAQSGRLQVTEAAEDHSALQSTALANVVGEDFPILRYRFEDFPRTLELALVFRTAEQPDDVQTVALPWPSAGESSVDLSRVAAWRGTIVELGFAEFATAQLVAPERGFAPFALVSARLQSASWQGRLQAMLTEWFRFAPWQLISVSAIGPAEIGDTTPHALRPPLVVAMALALLGLCLRFVLGLPGQGVRRWMFVSALSAWLAMDASWLRSLAYKYSADRDVWSDVPFADRQNHVADSDILAAATKLKQLLVNEPPSTRILVDASSPHDVLRFIYLASPLNLGAYGQSLLAGSSQTSVPPGAVLVRYGDSRHFRPVRNRLRFGKQTVRVTAVTESDEFAVYRVAGAPR